MSTTQCIFWKSGILIILPKKIPSFIKWIATNGWRWMVFTSHTCIGGKETAFSVFILKSRTYVPSTAKFSIASFFLEIKVSASKLDKCNKWNVSRIWATSKILVGEDQRRISADVSQDFEWQIDKYVKKFRYKNHPCKKFVT